MSKGGLLIPLVLAAIGLVPLGVLAAPTPPPRSTPASVVTSRPPTASAPEAVVVTTPPPTIHGVSDEVARVLAAQGFAAREVVDGLPESVVAVLEQHDVVLTVAVPGS